MTNDHNPSDRPGSADMPGNQAPEDGESMRSERSPGGFTEGPWNSGPMNPFAVDAPNGELICETEDEANARLIAQAPEMFELISQIVSEDWVPTEPVDRTSENIAWRRMLKVLREVRGE